MQRDVGAWSALLALQLVLTAHLGPTLPPAALITAIAVAFWWYAAMLHGLCRSREPMRWLPWILGAAIVARIGLALAEPVLSDDIYRYVWEGRVTAAGLNPFEFAPASGALEHLRDDVVWPRINHPEISAIYPPFAQFLFAMISAFGGGLIALRLAFIAIELGAVGLAWRLAGPRRFRVWALAAYLLNPLVMVECAWSGHLDVVAWSAAIVALLYIAQRPRGWAERAGAFLGISIATKLLAVVVVPFLMLRRRDCNTTLAESVRGRAVVLGVAAAVVIACYIPFSAAGSKLFGGFGTYAASWRSNDGVFRAVSAATATALNTDAGEHERIYHFSRFDESALQHGFTKRWQGEVLPNTSFTAGQIAEAASKLIAAFVCLIALLWCIAVVRDPIIGSAILLLTLYLVAPTVHPWYVAWLVPFAALRTNRTLFVFSAIALIGYVPWISLHSGGAWQMPWWSAAIEYVAVLGVLTYESGSICIVDQE